MAAGEPRSLVTAVPVPVVIRRLARRNTVRLCPDGVHLGKLPSGQNSLCQDMSSSPSGDAVKTWTHLLAVVQALEVILTREFAPENARCGQGGGHPRATRRGIYARSLLLAGVARLRHALAEIYEEAVAAADSAREPVT